MQKIAVICLIWLGAWNLPVSALDFTRGPFIQKTTTNSLTVLCQTSEPSTAQIEYGRTQDLGSIIPSQSPETNHVWTLGNLQPDTRYFYRVTCRNEAGQRTSEISTFATLKTEGPVSFAVISDTALNGYSGTLPPQVFLADVLDRLRPDLVLHLGDIVVSNFNPTNVQSQFFDFFQPVIRHTPFFFLLGNHDLFPGPGETTDLTAPRFHETFRLPTNSMDGTSRYYSFDHGNVHFVCLFNPWFAVYEFTAETDQYRWLTNDLAHSTKPWNLLFFHAPVATCSLHADDDYNLNGRPDQMDMMDLIAPLTRRYQVQMVFNGHDHSLHRYPPHQGLHFCVTAGGGQILYPFTLPYADPAKYYELHHCLKVSITNDTMTLEAFNTLGIRFDTWTVQKGRPPRRLYQSAWHTPDLTCDAANDGDGNVLGQRFDFVGDPIYPQAGEFSNLGRVFINNDQTQLYLGWEQIMIHPDNVLLLFIESPRRPGVASMAGLGNGKVDPSGEGVDGLDCLENLAFTNFTPCLGGILGDEYADQSYRRYRRPGMRLDTGQGVFRLDKSLSDVPGVRLQQFDLSPQLNLFSVSTNSIQLEQNADYIQLAIPLSELGDLQPGDSIQIGAVVAGNLYQNIAQTQWLDTSFLGYSLTGWGLQPVILEGLRVRLALPPWLDSDGDGLLNWQEELAGTDPTDPQSALQVHAVPVAPHQLRISWPTVPGKRYLLEWAADLNAGFVPFPEVSFPRTANSTNDSQLINLDAVAAPSAGGFYRIRLIHP